MNDVIGISYILCIQLNKSLNLKIGRLDEIDFKRGSYIYVGSAKKNLKNRLYRHAKKQKKIFWHIDYLLSKPESDIKEVWVSGNILECSLAKRVTTNISCEPIKRFGSSDCNCKSHLFFIKNGVDKLKNFLEELSLNRVK